MDKYIGDGLILDDYGYINSFKEAFNNALKYLADKNSLDTYPIDRLHKDTGIPTSTLYAWKRGARQPYNKDLTVLIEKFKSGLIPNFNAEYLLCFSNRTTTDTTDIDKKLGVELHLSTVEAINKIKDELQLDSFSKLVTTSNFINLLRSIETVSNSHQKEESDKSHINSLSYGQWLLYNELKTCIEEITTKDFTPSSSFYKKQQKCLDEKRKALTNS